MIIFFFAVYVYNSLCSLCVIIVSLLCYCSHKRKKISLLVFVTWGREVAALRKESMASSHRKCLIKSRTQESLLHDTDFPYISLIFMTESLKGTWLPLFFLTWEMTPASWFLGSCRSQIGVKNCSAKRVSPNSYPAFPGLLCSCKENYCI